MVLVLEHSAKIKPKTPICEMRSNSLLQYLSYAPENN